MSNHTNKKANNTEPKVDILDAELLRLDSILKKSGFSGGVETIKRTVEGLLKEVEEGNSPKIDFDSLFG